MTFRGVLVYPLLGAFLITPQGGVNFLAGADRISHFDISEHWEDAQTGMTKETNVRHVDHEFDIARLDDSQWDTVPAVAIDHYWSGKLAPATRHATAQLLWSKEALYVRYECAQHEPLITSKTPVTNAKSLGLWDRDVAEIFIGPDINQPERYLEFEAAPTGEWVDLSIRQLPDRRETDFEYHSGVKTAGHIEKDRVLMGIRIPWKAIGFVPQKGQRLRGNLFRCVGDGPDRGYLAWSPTGTPEPNFHVPSALGWFVFE